VEAVAARDVVARNGALFVALAKKNARRPAVETLDSYVPRLEENLPASGETCGDEILDDFMLRVDGNRATSQRLEIDTVAASIETQFDAAVHQPLAAHSIAHAGGVEQVHRALLEHARADTFFNVRAALRFDNDTLDTLKVQQMG
jgi:hypothetical protein